MGEPIHISFAVMDIQAANIWQEFPFKKIPNY